MLIAVRMIIFQPGLEPLIEDNHIWFLRGSDLSNAVAAEWNHGNDLKLVAIYLKPFFIKIEASTFLCLCYCS